MHRFLLLTVVFLVAVTTGQKQETHCSIDPDLIYFEDKDLEAVMKSLYSSGNCSAVVWKEEVVNVLKKHKKEILDMSTRDKSMLRYLISFVVKPEAERPPPDYFLYLGTLTESEIMNPLDFGPSPAEHQDDSDSPILWKFGSEREAETSTPAARSKRQLRRFRPSLPRDQRPETFPFDDQFGRPPRFVGNRPSRYIDEESSNYHSPDSKNVFEFGNEMQQNHWDPFSYEDNFSQERQPKPRQNDANFRPTSQQTPGPGHSWTNPRRYRPRDDYRDYYRPRPQGHPGGSFSRPPNKDSGHSFTPDNHRRPPGDVGGFYNPQRPQSADADIFMPDDQRLPGILDDENNVFVNTNQVTTERVPTSTTRPGPPTWATPPSLCVRNCPNTPEFNPVCGSDRVTYSNPGRLRCEQQCGKARVVLNYYGSCITTTTDFSTQPPQTTPSSLSRRSRNRDI